MKRLLYLLMLFSFPAFGQLQLDTVYTGTGPNTGTGDNLRNSMIKINRALVQLNRIGLRSVTSNYQELNILDGALVNYSELNKLVGIGTDSISTRAYARSVSGGLSQPAVSGIVHDSLTQFVSDGEVGLLASDTVTKIVTLTQLNAISVSGGFKRLSFIVGTTENAPSAGDSVITHGAFMNSYVDVFRTTGAYTNRLVKVFNNNAVDELGYSLADSSITFHGASFSNGDRVELHIYPTSSVQNIALRDTTPTGDQTPPVFVSAEIGTYNDSIAVVIFSENLQQDSIPTDSNFGFNQNGIQFGFAGFDISYDTLFIALDSIPLPSDPIAMTYTNFTRPQLQDSANNIVATFADSTVVNNISASTNMLTNGDFAVGTDWTIVSGTIGSGIASFDNLAGGELYQVQADMVSPVIAETAYTLTFDLVVDAGTSKTIEFSSITGQEYISYAARTEGAVTLNFTAPANIGSGGLKFYIYQNSGGTTCQIDNITLTAQ